MFQFFPFSNAHQLNLDWILETISKLPWTVNNTYPDELHNINLPTVAGMSSWNGIGADGVGNVNPAEHISDLDNAAEGFHIYHWNDPVDSNIPTDATLFPAGEGYCISCANAGGYICQLSNGLGSDSLALREKNPGYPWSPWRYLMGTIDISSNITLDTTHIDTSQPFTKFAYIQNGWCFGYFQGQSAGILSGDMTIASGLPTPLCDPVPYQFVGMLELLPATELRPCKFMIYPNGDLTFSYIGNTEEAGDVIVVQFAYPIK